MCSLFILCPPHSLTFTVCVTRVTLCITRADLGSTRGKFSVPLNGLFKWNKGKKNSITMLDCLI